MRKRIAISVSNDTYTDQRVHKQCKSLMDSGFDIVLYGREMGNRIPGSPDGNVHLISVLFRKGFMFYALFNIQLFFKLLFTKADIFYANDLDTLPANYLVSVFRRKPLIYDSHEYFTEVPEIQNRLFVKNVWKFFERTCIRRCDVVITVSQSISDLLKSTYNLDKVYLVRNLPFEKLDILPYSKSAIGVEDDRFLIVLQGAGINVDRGAEELVEAMAKVKNATLMIIGSGDALPFLKTSVNKLGLSDKVIFKPKMPFEEMMRHTAAADLGVSLDKDTNLNYRYSLPNKVFDYALAGVPVLVSDLVEVEKLVLEYQIGEVVEELTPNGISNEIKKLQENPSKLATYKSNTKNLVESLNWKDDYKPVLEKLKTLG